MWVFQEEIREMNLRIKNADDERMSGVGDCIYSHIHTCLYTYIQSLRSNDRSATATPFYKERKPVTVSKLFANKALIFNAILTRSILVYS